jgi:hypothetical protein
MRSADIIRAFLVIALTMPAVSYAQSLTPEVAEAGKRVDEAFDKNLKGWTRVPVTPIQGSTNVIIESWRTYDRWVRVSIGIRSLESERDTQRLPLLFQKIEGIGDDAVVWGYFGNVTFRQGNIGVSVSSEVDLNLLSHNQNENRSMSRTESVATSRLIACFTNLALQGKLSGRFYSKDPIFQRPCEQELVFKRLIGEDLIRQMMMRY